MVDEIKEFVLSFFTKLNCKINCEGEIYTIENIPKSFLDLLFKENPLRISFIEKKENCDFIDKHSSLLRYIEKYLDSVGKTTLLKIDFNVDPIVEIKKYLSLNNCKINNIIKKNKNNFFSRFSFLTTFCFLNEKEQLINEIYVHEGVVVDGDLSGYNVIEGNLDEINPKNLKKDYEIAKSSLSNLIKDKKDDLSLKLSSELNKEIERINKYYNTRLNEYSNELNNSIEKVKDLELKARLSEGEKKEVLISKISKLKSDLIKISNNESKDKIIKEKNFSIKDAQQKFSLNLSNKLLNTTIIYYPIFIFNLFLDNETIKKNVQVSFNPLTKDFEGLRCDSCNSSLNNITLCSGGHLICKNCIKKCHSCNKIICERCITKKCYICGREFCKDCIQKCSGCGNFVCNDHIRKDFISSEDFCFNCLRACSKCHRLTQEKFFGFSENNSKICQSCIAEEKRNNILKNIFD
ncbi:MAG: hypothetical protein WC260_00740 [Candidatus Pacearchaeota archaeon]